MGYDLYPADTAQFKEELLKEAAARNCLLIFEHSPRMKVGRIIQQEGGGYIFSPETYD
jgi:hypothetical protein